MKEVPLRQSDMKRELNYSGDLMRQQNPLNPSSHLPMAVALTSGAFFFYSNFKFPANDRVFVTGKLTNHLTFFCSSRRGQKKETKEKKRRKNLNKLLWQQSSPIPCDSTWRRTPRPSPIIQRHHRPKRKRGRSQAIFKYECKSVLNVDSSIISIYAFSRLIGP